MRTERGTALVLTPAMALVFVVLAAIAVDLTLVSGAQQAASRVIEAAADDAAGMLDGRAHQLDGRVRIDPIAAERTARAHLSTADLPGHLTDVEIRVTDSTVDVTARIVVPHVFLKAVPGHGDRSLSAPIHARARLLP